MIGFGVLKAIIESGKDLFTWAVDEGVILLGFKKCAVNFVEG
jgi:hypothetical protein